MLVHRILATLFLEVRMDFNKLLNQPKSVETFDLEALFRSLDVKGSHTELRKAQSEALKEITERHSSKDIVLKISTGAGKTTVGLLFLYAHLKLTQRPVVFLCPTIQLVEQTLNEASRLGIPASHYPAKEPHPSAEAMHGREIIVCTYDKLFNARSTFNRADVALSPVAFVCDDTHSGIEIVRKTFTLKLSGGVFDEFRKIIGDACQKQEPSKWINIEQNNPFETMEVPFWILQDRADVILATLNRYAETKDFVFVWPFLAGILSSCRCVISGAGAEIVPEVLPIEEIRAFTQAKHRLFMSATLADDSVLVRELGVSSESAMTPVVPESDRGLGERMILAPSLVDHTLERGYVMRLCAELSKQVKVAVLSPNTTMAKDWANEIGATVFTEDSFSEGVAHLKNPASTIRCAVFVQRYDGVDLPDDSCRVLVIDGMPFGEGIIDRYDASAASTPGGIRNRVIYRIEQGMGRAVRSHADYAVVMLIGHELASFIGRKEILENFTQDTRNQLKLSVEMAEHMRKSDSNDPGSAVAQTIYQCLTRNQGWKDFYNARVRNQIRTPAVIDTEQISLASTERLAHAQQRARNFVDAKKTLQLGVDKYVKNDLEKGTYLQRIAKITNNYDQAESFEIQQHAYRLNSTVSIPPMIVKKPLLAGRKTHAELFRDRFIRFENPNAAISELQTIKHNLDYNNNYRVVEKALASLGEILGAQVSRPDHELNIGPDVLWLWGPLSIVIEAKNENQKSLHKKDAGQLMQSVAWYKDSYPTRDAEILILVAAKVTLIDSDAIFPEGTKLLTPAGLDSLLSQMQTFYVKLIQEGPVFATVENIAQLMQDYRIAPSFLKTYLVKSS